MSEEPIHIVVTDNFSVVGGIVLTILNHVESITDKESGQRVTASNFYEVFSCVHCILTGNTAELPKAIAALRLFGRQILTDDAIWHQLPSSVSDGVKLVSTGSMKRDLAATLRS